MPADDINPTLVAVDIGNSRIKLGRFARARKVDSRSLPAPQETFEMPLTNRDGDFDAPLLAAWCCDGEGIDGAGIDGAAQWWISSVHRGAAERLVAALAAIGSEADRCWSVRHVGHKDIPLAIDVEAPQRVGMDRLLAAVAANQLRAADRAAIVVDLGTAIKVDLVTTGGAFAGGAIMPGLSMAARALAEQTDALPLVEVGHWESPPPSLGKATTAAIEAGLFWGAVGAIRELIERLSTDLALPPDVFISGGASRLVAEVLADGNRSVRHVPNLVLAGIALAADR